MAVRPDVEALIRAGLSNAAIARELHVSTETARRTRVALGEPPSPHGHPGGLTLAEAWQARTRAVGGGHLAWAGHRNSHGVPTIHWRGRRYSAYRIAYRARTGREPEGKVRPACDMPGCIAPAHVEDRRGHQLIRALERDLRHMPPPPATCRHGHDQAVHGRTRADNHRHYCAACDAARPVTGAGAVT